VTSWKKQLKSALRKTPLFKPLKYMAAIFGRSTYPLPFSHIEPAAPFLDRAIARIGHAPDPDRKDEQFYSYFSEMWAEGYEDGLQQQYEAYLPYIQKDSSLPFLDVGCGAGEFVKYLASNGISSCGIDSNKLEVERAKYRGLDVRLADAMTYLEKSSEAFSGVSLIEVIEHLPIEHLKTLLLMMRNALSPGGLLSIETINPNNRLAFNAFYADPTHTRPIPSEYLAFLVQWTGFTDVKIIHTGPMAYSKDEYHNASRAYLVYAIIAKKA
jgi:O-antigen chain-terminating methyltransferase